MTSFTFFTRSLIRPIATQRIDKIKNALIGKSADCSIGFFQSQFATIFTSNSHIFCNGKQGFPWCSSPFFSTMQKIQLRMIEDDVPVDSGVKNVAKMTNDELEDTSTIPGWDLIHSPPKKYPRGALIGLVVSDKMDKTINVAVDRYKIVPKIRKRMKYTKKFMAHDENEVANTGDLVMITPCHRLSKRKHFMLREIIKAKGQL